MLPSEKDDEATGEAVLAAFKFQHDDEHDNPLPVFEHGHWWINCGPCGAQYSVVDVGGIGVEDGFDFEQVSEGDESCPSEA